MTLSSSSSAAAALVGNSKDLVCEILSKLPLNSVMRFRLVCKEWCSLASTQSFIDMHQNINQTPPYFVVQYFDNYGTSSTDDYFLDCPTSNLSDHFNTQLFNLPDDDNDDDNDDNVKMKSIRESINLSSNFSLLRGGGKLYHRRTNVFHKKTYYHIKLISSCRGFLLFTAKPAVATNMSMSARFRRWLTKAAEEEEEEDPALILYNPITKEKHTVTAPPSTHVYCGFYYHSPTKEHRILYQLKFDPHEHKAAGVVKFLVFGLQTKSTRVLKLKVNNYITPDYDSRDTAYYNQIDTSTPPVISNGSLHWFVSEHSFNRVENPSCSRSILSFAIESEEFYTMPHPPLSHTCHIRIRISDNDIVSRYRHRMNLLEMDGGILCLCDGYCSVDGVMKPILEIYVVEDYKKWTWIKRYCVDVRDYIQGSPKCLYGLHYKALQILQEDQLLLVMMEGYPGDKVKNWRLVTMIIKPDKNWKPSSVGGNIVVRTPGYRFPSLASSVGGNMVVLTPSLASLQHNRSAHGIRTFFSIRTNRNYEYI